MNTFILQRRFYLDLTGFWLIGEWSYADRPADFKKLASAIARPALCITKGSTMANDLEVKVSKYASYLLRHNPEDLEMDDEGFVNLDELISKVKRRYPMVSKGLLTKIVDQSERKRFEILDNKICALYGHTVEVHMRLIQDEQVARLYHGTAPQAVRGILEKGLLPMRRRWVHLSPTEKIAWEVGKRRTNTPVVLEIDASAARRDGIKLYRAADKVYVCKNVPPKYIKLLSSFGEFCFKKVISGR